MQMRTHHLAAAVAVAAMATLAAGNAQAVDPLGPAYPPALTGEEPGDVMDFLHSCWLVRTG